MANTSYLSTVIEDNFRGSKPLGMIGANCVIESGAGISHNIADNYSLVSGLTRLDSNMLFGNYCIDASGNHFDIEKTEFSWLITDARRQPGVDEQKFASSFRDLLTKA